MAQAHPSIPRVVVRCVDYLRERAMHVSGIFQINVAKTDIMNAWKHLEAHDDADFSGVNDPHVISGLLKLFLRKEQETPLNFALVSATKVSTGEPTTRSSDIFELQSVVQNLTSPQYHLLHYLIRFLHDVSLDDDINEMSVHDLTQCFAPLLCRPEGSTHMSVLHIKALTLIKRFTQILIEEHEKVFVQSPKIKQSPSKRMFRSPLARQHSHGSQIAYEILKSMTINCISSFFKTPKPPQSVMSQRRSQHEEQLRTCKELETSVAKLKHQQREGLGDNSKLQLELYRASKEYESARRNIRGDSATAIQSMFRGASTRMGKDEPDATPPKKEVATNPDTPPALTAAIKSPTQRDTTPPAATPEKKAKTPEKKASPQQRQPVAATAGRPLSAGPSTRQTRSPEDHGRSKAQTSQPAFKSPNTGAESAASSIKPNEEQQGILEAIQRLCSMSLPRLDQEKTKIKQQLKQFDIDFVKMHNRKPNKSEKEPMRSQYERYNDIKLLITSKKETSSASTGTPDVIGMQLGLEKHLIQRKLRRFETNFEATHGRKVRLQKDIEPVEAEYRRYKELKAILRHQSPTDEDSPTVESDTKLPS